MTAEAVRAAAPARRRHRRPRIQSAVFWGVLSGVAATAAVALTGTDRASWPAVIAVAALLGFVGYLDGLTHRIRDRHTAILGALALLGIAVDQIIESSSITIIAAIAMAVIMFALLLGVAIFTGGIGGGDVKIAPFISLTLALVSPLTPMLWLLLAVLLAGLHLLVLRLSGRAARRVALGSWMAIAFPVSIVVTAGISALVGYPLTFAQV